MTNSDINKSELQKCVTDYFSTVGLSGATELISSLFFHFIEHNFLLKKDEQDGGFTDRYVEDTTFRTMETINFFSKLYEISEKRKTTEVNHG
jgi:hypothetical protein